MWMFALFGVRALTLFLAMSATFFMPLFVVFFFLLSVSCQHRKRETTMLLAWSCCCFSSPLRSHLHVINIAPNFLRSDTMKPSSHIMFLIHYEGFVKGITIHVTIEQFFISFTEKTCTFIKLYHHVRRIDQVQSFNCDVLRIGNWTWVHARQIKCVTKCKYSHENKKKTRTNLSIRHNEEEKKTIHLQKQIYIWHMNLWSQPNKCETLRLIDVIFSCFFFFVRLLKEDVENRSNKSKIVFCVCTVHSFLVNMSIVHVSENIEREEKKWHLLLCRFVRSFFFFCHLSV